MDYKKEKTIPPELYEKANIKTVEQCIEQIKRVGLPVMIKASEGGGGKGESRIIGVILGYLKLCRYPQGDFHGSDRNGLPPSARRDPRIAYLRHASCSAVAPLGGSVAGRHLRECYRVEWEGLLRAAPAPEDP